MFQKTGNGRMNRLTIKNTKKIHVEEEKRKITLMMAQNKKKKIRKKK